MSNERRKARAACRFPSKRRYTKAQARRAAGALRAQGQRGLTHFACPSGGHWHLGNHPGGRKNTRQNAKKLGSWG